MNAIEIKNLTKSYSGFCLDNINLELPAGTIMGLIGENGAGKSTTIRLIMDATRADSGTVSVLGVSNQSREFVNVKQDIGVVLDEACFPEVLTAENVNRIMKDCYRNWSEETFFRYINNFSIPPKKLFKDYSRGMTMKLAIASALSHEPKLLILDEATSGLDPMVRDEILDVFNDFTKDENHSILISSHIISDLEKICDYIAFIHKGRLMFCDEKDYLLERYAVIKLSEENFDSIPPEAVIRSKKTSYGYDALVLRDRINPSLKTEHTGLEDIILFMSREEKSV